MMLILFLFNRLKITHYAPYFLVGIALWFCVLKSGVHATLAGVVLAFAIPIRDPKNPEFSPLRHLEHMLHPWVAFAGRCPLILGTGGFANLFAEQDLFEEILPDLVLDGLRVAWQLNSMLS